MSTYKGFTIPDDSDPVDVSQWFADFADSASPLAVPIVSRTASHTLALSDAGAQVEVASASATTVTVPTDAAVAFPVGSTILLVQAGAGQVTVAGAAGVTVNATPGLKLYGQWSTALLVKRAANVWLLSGDLSA